MLAMARKKNGSSQFFLEPDPSMKNNPDSNKQFFSFKYFRKTRQLKHDSFHESLNDTAKKI